MQEIQQDYRHWLKAELERRQRVNSRYSLRSFAQNLELSPSFLSKVLNGKKNLSIESAYDVSEKLQLSSTERKLFCQWVARHSIGDIVSEITSDKSEDMQSDQAVNLELEAFQVISDWYHFAIRELTETKNFKDDANWIAQRLGISPKEAREGFARLVKLKLIEKKRGRYKKTAALLATPSGTPSQALRNHHSQMIHKANEALNTQGVLERSITGITIPTHPEKIEMVHDEIKRFRRRMAELLDTKNPSEVYQLNIQLFRLSEIAKGNRENENN